MQCEGMAEDVLSYAEAAFHGDNDNLCYNHVKEKTLELQTTIVGTFF
jgi:hypothetical protein